MTATVRQSVFVVPAICVVARSLGCYDEEGVEVIDVPATSSALQHADIGAGHVDVAITSTDNLLAWNAAGSNIVQIAQIESTTDLALVLRPGLSALNDAGRPRLAVDASTNGFAIVAYAMLERLGWRRGSYEVIEAGGVLERYDTVLDGRADATLVAPPLDEEGMSAGMRVLMRTAGLEPGYPGLGIVCDRARVDQRADAIARYLAALEQARRWIHERPPEHVATRLAAAGHGPRAAQSAIRTNPSSLRAAAEGLAVLADLRARLSLEIAGSPSPAELVLTDHPALAALRPSA